MSRAGHMDGLDITTLLHAWAGGDAAAREELWAKVTLDERIAGLSPPGVDVLDLGRCAHSARGVRSAKEPYRRTQILRWALARGDGHVLDISVATIERDWQATRVGLYTVLKGAPPR